MMKASFGGWLAGLALVAAAAHAQEPGEPSPGAKIVAQLDSLAGPRFEPSKAGDPEYIKELSKQREALVLKRRKMVEDLWRAERTHPRMAEFMELRWSEAGALAKSQQDSERILRETIAEIDAMFKSNTGETPETTIPAEVKATAEYWRAASEVRLNRDRFDLALKAADAYADRPEVDASRAILLYTQAAFGAQSPEQSAQAYGAVVKRFPENPQTPMVRGLHKRIEGIGAPFPLEFADAVSGAKVTSASLAGKVVLVEFFSTTLEASRERLVLLKMLQRELGPQGLQIVGICLDKDMPATEGAEGRLAADMVKSWAKENGVTWLLSAPSDPEAEWIIGWGVVGLPSSFIVDRQGRLRHTSGRTNLKGDLEELLKAGG